MRQDPWSYSQQGDDADLRPCSRTSQLVDPATVPEVKDRVDNESQHTTSSENPCIILRYIPDRIAEKNTKRKQHDRLRKGR